jgi:hypothetical protein
MKDKQQERDKLNHHCTTHSLIQLKCMKISSLHGKEDRELASGDKLTSLHNFLASKDKV